MKWPSLIAACLVVAACAGPKIDPPQQAAVLPPSGWRSPLPTVGNVDAEWWQAFNDPTLTGIVERALANNVDIAVAATRVAQARAQFRLARAQKLPNVAFSGGAKRERDVNPGFGIPELQTAGEGQFEASYDLDIFGRLADTGKAAHAAVLGSEDARDSIRLAVASSVASGYITLRALDARLAVLRDTLAAREAELKIAQSRTAAGYSSQLDLAQAQAEYNATEQLIPATQLLISRQEDGLNLLVGDNPGIIHRGAELEGLSPPEIPGLIPAILLRQRPDIAAAEQQLAAADHALDAARDAFMPDIQLSGSGGYVGSTLVTGGPIAVWALGGSILAPIFDAGRLQAQQDAATARRDEAAYTYRKAALSAFRDVEDALAAVQRDGEQERSLIAERDVLSHTLVLASSRYRAGYSPYLDQLDAQRGLLSARLSLVQLHADRLNVAVALFQALGGGWHARPDSGPRGG
jgi:multidrug efflux system outer membrane protein